MRKMLLSVVLAAVLTLMMGMSAFAGKETTEGTTGGGQAPPVGATAPEQMKTTEVTGKVVNFDEKLGNIVIQTPDGKTTPYLVQFPDHLKDIHAGDMVTIRAVNAVTATSITKSAGSEAAPGPGEPGPAPKEKAPAK